MEVMRKTQEHGANLEKLRSDLKNQMYNEMVGTYYILLKRLNDKIRLQSPRSRYQRHNSHLNSNPVPNLALD